MKLTEEKKEGFIFSGPWIGATESTKIIAEQTIQSMINENKGCAVIAKIFEVFNQDYNSAKKIAYRYFDRIKKEMIETKELFDKPIRRKKKRPKKLVPLTFGE